jgi:hypothetical protein
MPVTEADNGRALADSVQSVRTRRRHSSGMDDVSRSYGAGRTGHISTTPGISQVAPVDDSGIQDELLLHASPTDATESEHLELGGGRDKDGAQVEEERFVPRLCNFWLCYPLVLLFTSGNIPKLTERQWIVLAVVCAMGTGRQFDAEIFPVSITRIQSSFNLTETEFGVLVTTVRIGDMMSVLAGPFIDTFGRRHIAALAVVGYSMASLTSALQASALGFGIFQMLSRFFMQVQASASYTLLVEEFDADKVS